MDLTWRRWSHLTWWTAKCHTTRRRLYPTLLPLLVDGFDEGPAGLRYARAAKTAAKHCFNELSSSQNSIKSLVSDLSSRQSSEEFKDEVAEAENKFDLLKKFLAAAGDIELQYQW